MNIIGCDFHTRFQQIEMLDTETGEIVEKRLEHESGEARRFYEGLKEPTLVGIESTGYARWFAEMLQELGHELVVGEAAKIRARDMMILFHSVTCDDLSAYGLRRRLLEFFENNQPKQIAGIVKDDLERRAALDNRNVVRPPAPLESWFEVDVALEILRRDFTVLAQHEVAGKWIDLVVEGGHARLAVECDGDKWHGADRYEADMQRQRQLERCGWEFFRVRESAFYADREIALIGLWQALEERGIFPGSRSESAPPENGLEGEDIDDFDDDPAEDDESAYDDEDLSSSDSDNGFSPSGRRAEEITAAEIQRAILSVLAKCPNQSCTLRSVTSRVLKEVGVLTRGNPRIEFERRVMRSLSALEKQESIERYRAKNKRVRLL